MSREQLAKRLRDLARHLEADPDHRHPTDLAARAGLEIVEAGLVCFLDGDQALARCRDWGGRGYSSGSSVEGHGKGGHSDPTSKAAMVEDTFTERGDELKVWLVDAAGRAKTAAREVCTLMATTPPLTESDRARCAEAEPGGCDAYAVDGRRCSPCRMWLARHPEAQHVPKNVIEARRHRARLAS